MDVETYINEKVKIFKNKMYFNLFKTILVNLSKNISIYRKQYSLAGRMEKNKNNLNSSSTDNISFWFYIMKIVLDKLKAKEKTFFIKNNLDVNPLVFSYLVKLCKIKLAKLEKLSIAENAPMENIIRLYLDLCQKEVYPEMDEDQTEQSVPDKKEDNNNNNTNTKKKQVKEPKKEEEDPNENDVKAKYGIGKLRLTYNRSLSRLFIGDTDEKSVQKKHLMSITVKKDRTLKINGIQMGKSESYAKRIINEIGEEKGNYIDDDLHRIINKFKREQKFLDDYKKNLKLEQNENIKKIKNNTKYKNKNMKNIKIINLYSPQKINIYKTYKINKSLSHTNFNSLKTSRLTTRNIKLNNLNNFNGLYNNSNSNTNTNRLTKIKTINFTNSIKKSNINNNKIKYIPKTPTGNRKIIFSGFNGKKKISKFTLNTFKKYIGNYPTSASSRRKFEIHNYFSDKNDFFFNYDFDI